jgi:hypothetical protein
VRPEFYCHAILAKRRKYGAGRVQEIDRSRKNVQIIALHDGYNPHADSFYIFNCSQLLLKLKQWDDEIMVNLSGFFSLARQRQM